MIQCDFLLQLLNLLISILYASGYNFIILVQQNGFYAKINFVYMKYKYS